jgi:tetratricopeptide (TPR) repeat protein
MAAPPEGTRFAVDSQFAFRPDSGALARVSSDGLIRIWNARDGTLVDTIRQSASAIAYNGDGTRLISVHSGGLAVWNTQTGALERRGLASGGPLRISRDGRWLAYGTADRVRLCELPSLKEVRTWRAHRDVLYGLNFTHDGKILATSSWDGTVKLWQVATGEELFTVPASGVVWSVAFSPDDRALAFAATGELNILRCVSSARVSKLRQESLAKIYEDSGRRGKWAEALAAVDELKKLQPKNHWLYHDHAALLVAVGDQRGYRQAVQVIQSLYGENKDPQISERMAKACLILPASGVDSRVNDGWIQAALAAPGNGETSPWNQTVKALSDLRQGDFASAAKWAEKAAAEQNQSTALNVQGWMILAMARWHLKEIDLARSSFARGDELVEHQLPKLEEGNLGWDWPHWIVARALHLEARQLIEGAAAGDVDDLPALM